jgi:hypothetical protein
MSSKKKHQTTRSEHPQTLKIGSRVRCTDDGVEGRIVWANGVAVKIEWTDGEKVTWKRESLAGRPIEILDADGEVDQTTAPAATDAAEITAANEAEQPAAPVDTAAIEPTATTEVPQAEPATTPTTADQHQARLVKHIRCCGPKRARSWSATSHDAALPADLRRCSGQAISLVN